MKRSIVLGLVVGVSAYASDHNADACGLKLTVKTAKAGKGVQPSANPSRILIVGDPPSRVESSLARAGHVVEVSANVDKAKTKDYRIVLIEDSSKAEAAHAAFPEANVIAMNRDPYRNLTAVEKALERSPSSVMAKREAVATAEPRKPLASGPDSPAAKSSETHLVASGQEGPAEGRKASEAPQPVEVAAKTTLEPAPAPIAAVAAATDPGAKAETKSEPVLTSRAETRRERAHREKTEKSERVATRVAPSVKHEKIEGSDAPPSGAVQFGFASATLSGLAKARLSQQANWLKQNPNGTLSLEGHTDSIGSSDVNMELSRRRVEAAAQYLSQLGVDSAHVKTAYFGEEKPVFGGRSDDPRNRCVVIRQE